MKVTREKAEENRQNVIETSGRLFRELGYDGVGVATLMQAVGLTHGGFYKQFKSKDDLIAQATKAAMKQSRDRLTTVDGNANGHTLETLVRTYLSEDHRDNLGQGCVLAALGADAARHDPESQAVIAEGVNEYVNILGTHIKAPNDAENRQAALAAVSTLVGALTLSRAVGKGDLSRDLLNAAANSILANNQARVPEPKAAQ